jgi:hypothetical protein
MGRKYLAALRNLESGKDTLCEEEVSSFELNVGFEAELLDEVPRLAKWVFVLLRRAKDISAVVFFYCSKRPLVRLSRKGIGCNSCQIESAGWS